LHAIQRNLSFLRTAVPFCIFFLPWQHFNLFSATVAEGRQNQTKLTKWRQIFDDNAWTSRSCHKSEMLLLLLRHLKPKSSATGDLTAPGYVLAKTFE